ncbi:MAG: membrane protein [Tepidiforma sp.]|nr:TRIC cation channel family protein [Tepidiforma sp.]GIW17494.1 MAG: membrane protein [Tepidiforma sp.]
MEFDTATLVGAFDRAGIVAFAFSGVEVGARRNLDVFGLLVMGVVTATGGGVMRDVILDRLPLILAHPDYLAWAVGGAIAAVVLIWRRARYPRFVLRIAEAGGLGAFAVAGALTAIGAGLSWSGAMLMAIVTAVGGGVIRDLLADRVPVVLHSEVNATAAGLGGLATWAVYGQSNSIAALFGLSVAALVYSAGAAFDLRLPRPGGRGGVRR